MPRHTVGGFEISPEAVERLIVRAENAAIHLPLSKGIVFGLCRSLRALSARLAEVEAECDMWKQRALHQNGVANCQIERAEAAEAKLALAVEGLTEIERLYYREGKDLAWRAAHMRGIAADVLNKLTAEEINNASD